ncbi:hypothetical protein ACSZMY_14625 [Aeromonas hydrophila]|nr:hypothetical protein [Aeromonas hydrophila]
MIKAMSNASEQELSRRQTFSELLHASPLPAAELVITQSRPIW